MTVSSPIAGTGLIGSALFGRAFSLVIGIPNQPTSNVSAGFNDTNATGLDVSGFDCEFQIEKNLKPEPNTCSIKIYNLSKSHQQQLGGAKKLTVSLSAGYAGNTSLLYLGEVRAAWTVKDDVDSVTTIESGDGDTAMRGARITQTLGAKVPIATAMSAVAQALGLGQGNIGTATAQLENAGITSLNGGALTGSAAHRMTDFCRSAGLEWSIQNGAIQILNIGKAISAQAFEISSSTGMIDSPTVDNKGVVSAKTLIIPGLLPGILVTFNTLYLTGGYRVERCKWSGQTMGDDWFCEFEAKKY